MCESSIISPWKTHWHIRRLSVSISARLVPIYPGAAKLAHTGVEAARCFTEQWEHKALLQESDRTAGNANQVKTVAKGELAERQARNKQGHRDNKPLGGDVSRDPSHDPAANALCENAKKGKNSTLTTRVWHTVNDTPM